MFHLSDVLAALQQHVSAADVARIFPQKGQRNLDRYQIPFADSPVREVSIDLQISPHPLAVPPDGVEYFFRDTPAVTLAQAVPFCKQWQVTTSSLEQPWSYLCRVEEKGKILVVIYASLSGDLHDPKTRLAELMLEKSV